MKKSLIVLGVIIGVCWVVFMIMNSSFLSADTDALTVAYNTNHYTLLPKSITEFVTEVFNRTEETTKEEKEPDETFPESPKESNGKTIYVDPGHGGDPSLGASKGTTAGGSFTTHNLSECENNYMVALEVKKLLVEKGYTVQMSRDFAKGTTGPGNTERGQQASKCNGYIGIHSNGGGGSGCFNVCNTSKPYNRQVGDAFISAMKAIGVPTGSNGYFNKALNVESAYIKGGGDMNHFLYVEIGAHDIEPEATFICSDDGRKEIAKCIVDAFTSAF